MKRLWHQRWFRIAAGAVALVVVVAVAIFNPAITRYHALCSCRPQL
ncbi:MAG: hypothetical protein H0W20_07295 [Chthoniobacterales bacterium]|jgi:hypothetical protein|nr:hypothetical protein [Chthoniobacterales bacterium]